MSRVAFGELFEKFFVTLESLPISYAAYGGVAVGVWGDPRETQDVDAVVAVEETDCARLLGQFAAAGFTADMRAETTFPIDGWLRLRYGGRFADLALGRSPFDQSALERRQRVTLFGRAIWVASAEDLVLYKLVAYRLKDFADVEAILVRRGKDLDRTYLDHWASEIASHTGRFEVVSKLEELLRRSLSD